MTKELYTQTGRRVMDPLTRFRKQQRRKQKKKDKKAQPVQPDQHQQLDKWKKFKEGNKISSSQENQNNLKDQLLIQAKRKIQIQQEQSQIQMKGLYVPGFGRTFKRNNIFQIKGLQEISVPVCKPADNKDEKSKQVPECLRSVVSSHEQLIRILTLNNDRLKAKVKEIQQSRQKQRRSIVLVDQQIDQ